jgi:hypothetical protein
MALSRPQGQHKSERQASSADYLGGNQRDLPKQCTLPSPGRNVISRKADTRLSARDSRV